MEKERGRVEGTILEYDQLSSRELSGDVTTVLSPDRRISCQLETSN